MGQLKNCKDKIGGIKWTENPVKVLGLYFGNNKAQCEYLNWDKKIENMKTQFGRWKKRNLSMLGKILIIKALIIPKFTFLASSTNVPQQYLKEIERQCYNFIWDGKKDKV